MERPSQLPPHFSSWQSWGQVDEENCPRASLSQEFKARTFDSSLVLFPGATCRALGRPLSLCTPFQSRPQSPPSRLFPHPPGLPFSSSFFLLYIFLILLPSRLCSSECPVVAHLFLYFFPGFLSFHHLTLSFSCILYSLLHFADVLSPAGMPHHLLHFFF